MVVKGVDPPSLAVLVISRSCAIASDLLVVATIMFYTRGRWSLAGDIDKRMPSLRVLIQRDGECALAMVRGSILLIAILNLGFVMFL